MMLNNRCISGNSKTDVHFGFDAERQNKTMFSEFLLQFAGTMNDCVSQTMGVILDDGLICHCEIL